MIVGDFIILTILAVWSFFSIRELWIKEISGRVIIGESRGDRILRKKLSLSTTIWMFLLIVSVIGIGIDSLSGVWNNKIW